ncbi:MAG: type II toxin-antitoxin system RelE/ParE family toxin [Betaproteobacteria bacterium]|nr:type II toxin-antitoxin system RelE/ParE family toxin [Betaproteobacteria bacterium]
MTIRSFRCADTEALYEGKSPRRFRNIENVAERKLQMLEDAVELRDLGSPPGNRLEALSGDRVGQHSIRINRQWRVCFVWTDAGPKNVEIVDYH